MMPFPNHSAPSILVHYESLQNPNNEQALAFGHVSERHVFAQQLQAQGLARNDGWLWVTGAVVVGMVLLALFSVTARVHRGN